MSLTSGSPLAHDLQYAIDLARGAGKIVLEHYGKVERLTKTHATTSAEAVTDADRASQRFIVAGLARRFPDDGIVGEENDTGSAITFDCPDPAGRVWVIDPIDGTNNFIAGLGNFAVCIGLLDAGAAGAGRGATTSRRDLMYSAAAGEGAWLGTRRLRVAQDAAERQLDADADQQPARQGRHCPAWAARWIAQTNWKVRMLGSAALEAVQVAAGVAHGAVTVNGKLWDVAAPAASCSKRRVSPTSGAAGLPLRSSPLRRGESPVPRRGTQVARGVVGRARAVGSFPHCGRHPYETV